MKSVFRVAAILLLATGIFLPTWLGIQWPEYNAATSYLSELGAEGAPHATLMNYLGFLPVGILWLMAVGCLYHLSPKGGLVAVGSLLLLATSVSYIGATLYPCDAGCPMEGSPSQTMHNLLGVVGYLATPPALFLLGFHYIKAGKRVLAWTTFSAALAFSLGFAALMSSDDVRYHGAWQRLADFSLFAWMFAAAFLLTKKNETAPA